MYEAQQGPTPTPIIAFVWAAILLVTMCITVVIVGWVHLSVHRQHCEQCHINNYQDQVSRE